MSNARPNNSSLLKTPSMSKLVKPNMSSTVNKSNIPSVTAVDSEIDKVSKSKVPLAPGVAEQYASNLLKKTCPKSEDRGLSFKVGDTVWVNGTKCGKVAFIGETEFAPGEWVGVYLDTPDGKNDGCVAGVRYFTCEPLRGVFAKASKLTTHPSVEMETNLSKSISDALAAPASTKLHNSLNVAFENDKGSSGFCSNASTPVDNQKDVDETLKQAEELKANVSCLINESKQEGTLKKTLPQKPTKSFGGGMVSKLPRSNHGSSVSINQFSTSNLHSDVILKVGDRVVVGGTKQGTLRFLGNTQFAKGKWAGIELDEPLGKNDGSVEGKRYFKCPQQFGLFAPLAKVNLASLSKEKSSLARSGSQESLSSVGSFQSTASRSGRVRLGITSFNQAKPKASSSSTLSSTLALEKALKEKEEHVEQLLAERDFERSEIARSETRMEELEKEMLQMKMLSQKNLSEFEELKQNLRELEEKNVELNSQLEEERRKVDDLQFTMEEASIDKVHWESEKRRGNEKLEEVMKQLDEQIKLTNQLNLELTLLKERQKEELKDINGEEKNYLEEHLKLLEELNSEKNLTDQLREQMDKLDAERKKLGQENEELTLEAATMKNEVIAKNDAIKQLEVNLLNLESLHKKNEAEDDSELIRLRKACSESLKEMNDLKLKLEEERNKRKLCELEKEKVTNDLKIKSQEFGDAMEKRENEQMDWKKLRDDLDLEKNFLKEEITKLQKNIEAATSEILKLKTIEVEKETLECEFKSLRVKMGSYENCRKQEEDELQQKLKDSEEKRICAIGELESFKLKALSREENQEAIMKELKENLVKQEEETRSMAQQYNDLKIKLEVSQKSLADLQEMHQTLKLELALKSNNDDEQVRVMQGILLAKESAEQQINTLKSEFSAREEKQVFDKENLKIEFESKISSLKKEMNNNEEELIKLRADFQTQANELTKLKIELEQKNTLLVKLRSSETAQDDSKLKKLREELHSVNVAYKTYIREAEEKLNSEAKVKESLEAEVFKLREDNRMMVENVDLLTNELTSAQNLGVKQIELINRFEKTIGNVEKENESLKEKIKVNEEIVKENWKEMAILKNSLQCEFELKEKLIKELEDSESLRMSLKNDLNVSEEQVSSRESVMLSLEEKVKELESLKSTLEAFDDIAAKLKQTETFNTLLEREKNDAHGKIREANEEINFLKKKLEGIHSDESMEEQKQQLLELRLRDEKLLLDLNEERKDNQELKEKITFIEQLMNDEITKLKNEQTQAATNHESEVNAMTSTIKNLTKECDGVKNSLKKLSDNLNVSHQQIENDKKHFELEKLKLEKEIICHKFNKDDSRNKVEGNNATEKISDLLAQIDFLNSVIVDIQRKNEKLQREVEILMDGSLLRNDQDDIEPTVIRNGIAPRFFCDICDVFDQHDTEDCPKQSDGNNEDCNQPPPLFQGDPNLERPYCDICEVFGHHTEDCNDEQTF